MRVATTALSALLTLVLITGCRDGGDDGLEAARAACGGGDVEDLDDEIADATGVVALAGVLDLKADLASKAAVSDERWHDLQRALSLLATRFGALVGSLDEPNSFGVVQSEDLKLRAMLRENPDVRDAFQTYVTECRKVEAAG